MKKQLRTLKAKSYQYFWHWLMTTAGDRGVCGANNQRQREAWLKSTLAQLPPNKLILDAGAGETQYKRFCSHLKYVSQDFGKYDGTGNQAGLQIGHRDHSKLDVISDIVAIPIQQESFDAVMCVEVLEHLPNPIAALHELTRVLKPSGTLILTAPFASLTHYAPYFYQTGYSRYFYEYWLNKLGYKIEDMQLNGNYFEYIAQELRRLPGVGWDYANTPIPLFKYYAIKHVLALLDQLSQTDTGSAELLAYGLHVRAYKL